MEKKPWLWHRRSSSDWFSFHSTTYSDKQDASPEVTSKASVPTNTGYEVKGDVMNPTEKPPAELVNVGLKEDLVRRHAKVSEKAVAGWEKAERVAADLEVRTGYLDTALKECLRQLKQVKDEQGAKEVAWESTKGELEDRIHDLQKQLQVSKTKNGDSTDSKMLKTLENKNAFLKQELALRSKELEMVTVERNLGTEAAETASKLQLECVNKVAKLEAECRRLRSIVQKLGPNSSRESHLDRGDGPKAQDIDGSHSGSWAMALLAQLDRFGKPISKGIVSCPLEVDMMGDFLETEVDLLTQRINELEKKWEKSESEKLESLRALEDARRHINELQKEVHDANEAKNAIESRFISMEAKARNLFTNVDSLKEEIERERSVSTKLRIECKKLKDELTRKCQESGELRKNRSETDGELKVNQEEVANKLVECQKTIASLGKQLKSLATLDEFLVETRDLSGLDNERFVSTNYTEVSKPVDALDRGRLLRYKGSHSARYGNNEGLPRFSSSPSIDSSARASKTRSGLGKIFARSKSTKKTG